MGGLIAAAAAAIAAAFNQKILVDGPEEKMAEARKANPAATAEEIEKAAGIPKGLRSGAGRPLLNIGLGVLTGIMLDTFAKKGSAVQKAALPWGAGWIAYGAALGVHDVIRKQNESQQWYIDSIKSYASSLKAEAPAATGNLYDVRSLEHMAAADSAALGNLYEGALPQARQIW